MIPQSIVYAGLAGLLLALIVAAAQNRWQIKVILLLALRLAIGWQFLFEGMHKIHSHMVGPTESNKPFTSEPYFRASPTELGRRLHALYQSPADAARLDRRTSVSAADFQAMSAGEQENLCPEFVRSELNDATYAERPDDAKLRAALRRYAAWLYGVEPREAAIDRVQGQVALTLPQRIEWIESLGEELATVQTMRESDIGRGNASEVSRAARLRQEQAAALAALNSDAKAFVQELIKDLGGTPRAEPGGSSRGELLDRATMWFIAAIGASLLLGLFTRLNCLLAAGFLAMTYAIHPPLPWLPLPPNTEGNPVFINKNIIELLALLVLACYPTGRWLGLDALLARCFRCRSLHATVSPTGRTT